MRDTASAERLPEEIRGVRGEDNAVWRWHRASLWLVGGQWRRQEQEVLKALEAWMLESPEASFPALTLVKMYLQLGRADQAETAYRRAFSLNSASVEVAEFPVTLLGQQRRPAEAVKVLETVAAKTPTQKNAALRLRLALAEGDLDAPMQELTTIAAGDPRDISARILLAGLAYERRHDVKLAMEYLDQAAAAAAILLSLPPSEALRQEVRKAYDRAVALDPKSTPARLNWPVASFLCGDLDGAEAVYRQVLRDEPMNPDALNGLAWLLGKGRGTTRTRFRRPTRPSGSPRAAARRGIRGG